MLELKGSDRPSPRTTKSDVACYSWLPLKHPSQPQQRTGQVSLLRALPSGAHPAGTVDPGILLLSVALEHTQFTVMHHKEAILLHKDTVVPNPTPGCPQEPVATR